MKLSIIVPIYNVEKYVAKCLNSLLNQDLEKSDYEIVVINDGTKDASAEIAKEIASRNSNVTVFDKENGGISSARNKGIELAKGDYTLFIDSDDYVEPNVLRTIIDECEKENLDMLAFNYRTVNENGDPVKFYKIGKVPKGVVSGIDFMISDKFAVMVWCYVYRTRFLRENQLLLKPYRHEDEEFTPRALMLCKKIEFLNLTAYNYLQRRGSYMNSYAPKNVYDQLSALRDLNQFIESGEVTDPRAILYIKRRVNHLFFITLKKAIRSKLEMEYVMLDEDKRHNIVHKGVVPFREKTKFRFMTIAPKLFINYLKLTYLIRNK